MQIISRCIHLAMLLWLVLQSSLLVSAAELPVEPILRIEPGDHTGDIRDIATDAQGRWLVTASQDKTARVWDASDGRLLRTLRIPIGDSFEGQLNALAFSPDGNTVAVGGVTTQFNGSLFGFAAGGMTVYLFDRASGRMLRRLTGMPSTVIHLAFSPDGRLLAAATGRGVYVFSVADGTLIARDTDYGGPSYAVDFSNDGRMVTSSWDGLIRLYSSDGSHFTLVAKVPAPGGKKPGSTRFSPDGSRIAVGYLDSIAVNVLDGRDLSLRYSADTAGITATARVGLFAVAWSRDGTTLYAAGDSKKIINGKEQHFIRRWSKGGAGPAQDAPTPVGSITYLATMPDHRFAFSSAEAAWGVLNGNGSVQFFHAPPVANFRDTYARFMLSANGSRVAFCYDPSCTALTTFDALNPGLNVADTAEMAPARTTAPGIDVAGWNTSYDAPKLNGAPLPLRPQEYSTSLAITPSGDGFALGTELYLRMFDRSGRERWERPSLSGVFAVNVSPDGRWVVAAYGDGTIRWHRASDGVEQLAVYPHPDKKRWVLWTPSGYYNSSPGAEDLIGWHVNRSIDQAADFYPISQFRDRFYRPDVVAKVIDTTDETEAVAQANTAASRREPIVSVTQILPPVVEVVSAPKQFASSTVKVSIRVHTPADAPQTGLRILVNGEIMATPRSVEPVQGDGAQEVTLVLPPRNSEVSIYADNKNGRSLPAPLSLQWAGDSKVFVAGEQGSHKTQKPKLWLLVVGVSAYRNPGVPQLSYASDDAKAFASLLTAQQGKAYREVESRVLTDDKATRANVLSALDWIRTSVGAGDVGVVFLAGHGFTMATDHRYYYASVDVDPKRLTDTGVSYAAIQQALTDFNGRGDGTRAVFFIDTCHSGDATGASIDAPIKASNGDALTGELTRTDNQVLVFASSKGNQFSWEDSSFRHGAFTEALIEGLGDKWEADPRNTGRVTYKNLDAWISDRVPVITQGRQTPRLMAPPGGVDDFVLGSK
jgi:WD40 repeat protein